MLTLRYMIIALLFLSVLNACQASVFDISKQPRVLTDTFMDLEQEYMGFRTQALTQSYLNSKIERWATELEGERMRREIEYARFKHPETLKAVMCAHPEFYDAAAEMDEVQEYITESTLFADYMDELTQDCPPS